MEETIPPRRVRLYELNPDGAWDDKGTGHAYLHANPDAEEGSSSLTITVRSEEDDGKLLLKHEVDTDIEYSRQGGTIVTWYEKSANIDLALSFQDVADCQEACLQISMSSNSTLLLAPSENATDTVQTEEDYAAPEVRVSLV